MKKLSILLGVLIVSAATYGATYPPVGKLNFKVELKNMAPGGTPTSFTITPAFCSTYNNPTCAKINWTYQYPEYPIAAGENYYNAGQKQYDNGTAGEEMRGMFLSTIGLFYPDGLRRGFEFNVTNCGIKINPYNKTLIGTANVVIDFHHDKTQRGELTETCTFTRN